MSRSETTETIYLDYAAATPLDERVLAAMQPYFAASFYNPSATYAAAVQARQALETARTRVAHWLGVRPSEITFTAGGTEANNLAVHGVMQRYPGCNIAISSIEHESVLVPAHQYNDCREVAVQPDGRLDLDDLRQKIDDQTVLVSIMYANNEIGTIEPLRKVASVLTQIRAERRRAGNDLPLYFHADACQAANCLDLHVARLGVDLLSLNGSKIYGPKQSGALYVRGGLTLHPLISGGGQEHGMRSGTENVAGSVGFAAALELVQQNRHDETRRLQGLQRQFYDLLAARVPAAVINGSTKHRLPGNVHLTLPGQDNERLLILLDEAGIQAAAGSACSASNEEPSHVLRAIGLDDAAAQASLRFTMGHGTNAGAIERTVDVLQRSLSAAA